MWAAVVVWGFGKCGGKCGSGGGRTGNFQFRQVFSDVRVVTVIRSSDVRLGPVVRVLGENRAQDELHNFGVDGSGDVEIERICGWKREGREGKARSTRSNSNP